MALFIPIQPEPASRIFAGRKLFELRKSRPSSTGWVFLYETKDETDAVHAVRGAFYFDEFLDLPLEQLWNRVGERATSRQRFDRYFGGKYKSGIALVIRKVLIFKKPIRVEELQAIDPQFSLPRGLWTYHLVPDDSKVISFLHSVPIQRTIDHTMTHSSQMNGELSVEPLVREADIAMFRENFVLHVLPNYPESEDYPDFVTNIHFEGEDVFGYFTKAKKVWVFKRGDAVVGFTVVSEKRGGSIKFGPTIILPEWRGRGYGAPFRLLAEQQYPHARKCYNTLPDNNLAALRYVLRAGYQIEAHLMEQYRRGSGEIVVGKLLVPQSAAPDLPPEPITRSGRLNIRDATSIKAGELTPLLQELLGDYYDEVNEGYVQGLVKAMTSSFSLSHKSKRMFLAQRGDHPVGVVIATPKRGGALKCSPLVVKGDDDECLVALLDSCARAFPERPFHKMYCHLPLLSLSLIRAAKRQGFCVEGVLREPYKTGIDMIALGRISK